MFLELLFFLGIAGLIALIGTFFMSDSMIFPAPPASYTDKPDTLKLKTETGVEITAAYLEASGSEQLLLYSHGNSEDIGTIHDFLEEFQKKGISVLVYDYPGYGTSSEEPSESGVYAAADAAYTFATEELNFAPEQIVLYGFSLGSGPSCWLAERYPIGRMILAGAFASTFRVVTRVKLLPADKFDNLSRLKKIYCSILLIHGTEDRVVPFRHAEKNWNALRGKKQKLWVKNAGHNNIPEVAGSLYWDTVISFIKQTDGVEQTNE